jgi:hypothetical protein
MAVVSSLFYAHLSSEAVMAAFVLVLQVLLFGTILKD